MREAEQAVSDEVELKLETTASGLDAISRSGLLGHPSSSKSLDAVYFDTPAHDLRRRGVSLRIRREEGQLVQTIKHHAGRSMGEAAGLFARSEWELPVDQPVPAHDPRVPLPKALFAALMPLFEVAVRRQVSFIEQDGSRIEVALDRGEVRAGERSTSFHEIELELRGGTSVALFRQARAIDAIAPIRIGVLTKAERGYRLLGPAPSASRARPIVLHNRDDLRSAFTTIAQSCISQFRRNEAILADRISPEAVHQARVALRRLRSAMALFKPLLNDSPTRRFRERIRRLARILGEVRDLDVLRSQFDPGAIPGGLDTKHRKALARLGRALAGPAVRRLMLDLAEWLAVGEWRTAPATLRINDAPLREFTARAFDRSRRRIRRNGRHLARIGSGGCHRLRKDAKELRYAIGFFGNIHRRGSTGRKRRQFLHHLERLQHQLGKLNDAMTAERWLTKLGLAELPEGQAIIACREVDYLIRKARRCRRNALDAERFWR